MKGIAGIHSKPPLLLALQLRLGTLGRSRKPGPVKRLRPGGRANPDNVAGLPCMQRSLAG